MCPGGKSEGTKYATYMDSPVGRLYLAEEGGKLTHLLFAGFNSPAESARTSLSGASAVVPALSELKDKIAELIETPLLLETKKQLREYFDGERNVFNLPLAPSGSDFQRACWEALLIIPYGQTRSYADIARLLGNPKAYRAVGNANHNNPISIVIPCHRVIAADGSLAGYGGGLAAKAFLLNLEQSAIGGNKVW